MVLSPMKGWWFQMTLIAIEGAQIAADRLPLPKQPIHVSSVALTEHVEESKSWPPYSFSKIASKKSIHKGYGHY